MAPLTFVFKLLVLPFSSTGMLMVSVYFNGRSTLNGFTRSNSIGFGFSTTLFTGYGTYVENAMKDRFSVLIAHVSNNCLKQKYSRHEFH